MPGESAKSRRDPEIILDQDGENPVILGGRLRQEARPHLLLHHEDGPADGRKLLDQPEQERRGDLIGQVAHHGQGPARGLAGLLKIELQHILADDLDPGSLGKQVCLEKSGQVGVPFQGDDPAGGFGQKGRQGP